ncbi:topoisomerase DNA-binding C4 zinc finger domain-containing protein [Pseudomonas cichorii]|uniref:topoisomerase DNA-binding C4 zinc finger domain-containing protein n=1 Tax=Pseudomonas cichorii TaxID=36746 RepID=UPI0027D9A70C|nr:topoisomerase DNA-binding C4 zinc finger domain-containing protein [Pseudomonas cichorii]
MPVPTAITIDIPKRTQIQPSRANPTPIPPRSSVSTTTRSSATNACPSCGASMVRRTARKGKYAGRQFWGCSKFPVCKGTRS